MPAVKDLSVSPDDGENQRLDVFLSSKIGHLGRAQVQRFIDLGQVLVNGQTKKPSYKLRRGDVVTSTFELPEPSPGLRPEDLPLEVIYADQDIIVLNKPPGQVVHPGAGVSTGTLVQGLLFRFPEIAGVGPEDRPGIVHRLDKETSGVMVAARNEGAYAALLNLFKKREVHKTYLGLVWGVMGRGEGQFQWAIGRHPKHGQRFSTRTRKPREAFTAYSVKQVFKEYSLLELRPVTGRTHQIRVHLSAAGHPLVGDNRYGRRRPKREFPRMFLHAWKLAFPHPVTGKPMEFVVPLPDELQKMIPTISQDSA